MKRPLDRGQKAFFKFIFEHVLIGTVGALIACVVVLYFDMGGIASLMRRSADGWLYLILLAGGFWVTFGGIALAVGFMGLGDWRDPPE